MIVGFDCGGCNCVPEPQNVRHKFYLLTADVQLNVKIVTRSVLSTAAPEQLESNLDKCEWFSIQCDESVNASNISWLAVFNRMAFCDFSTKEEFLIPLLLKTTTKGVELFSTVKDYSIL